MPTPQKLEERRDLELFADAIGLPELKAARDALHPDFLIGTGDDVLGIEHTLLYSDQPAGGRDGGSAIRRAEALFNEFSRRARATLGKRHPNAEAAVGVERQSKSPSDARDIPTAVEEFVELVAPHLYPPAPELDWCSDGAPPSVLANFCDAVHVKPWPQLGRLHWAAPTIGWAATQVYPSIADHIREKDEKRRSLYAVNCSRAWLLLVATGASAASIVWLSEFAALGVPTNGFERIYLLDRWTKNAKQLWPGEPAGADNV